MEMLEILRIALKLTESLFVLSMFTPAFVGVMYYLIRR